MWMEHQQQQQQQPQQPREQAGEERSVPEAQGGGQDLQVQQRRYAQQQQEAQHQTEQQQLQQRQLLLQLLALVSLLGSRLIKLERVPQCVQVGGARVGVAWDRVRGCCLGRCVVGSWAAAWVRARVVRGRVRQVWV